MQKIILSLIFAICLQACATATIEKLNTHTSSAISADTPQTIYIALPKDGVYKTIQYPYSGQQVQQAFFEAFSRYSDEVILGSTVQNFQEAKDSALAVRAQILVYPVIIHWEDRNTPWSGLRDKVRINVQVFNVNTDVAIDKTSLYATNRWLALLNAAPSNLLKKIIWPYVEQLYS